MRACFIYFFLFSFSIFAQKKTNFEELKLVEDTLQTLLENLYLTEIDSNRHKKNQQLLTNFERILKIETTFYFPFDSLKNYMAILPSSDGEIRIINWDLPKNDGTYEYYGFIQKKHTEIKKSGLFKTSKTETIKVYPLIDKSLEIKDPQHFIGDNTKWFGALYYKIIVKKYKSKVYYTLLAFANNDRVSQKKIIDVLTFDSNGIPHFGDDIFMMPKKTLKRVIFEYSTNCVMSLKYSNKKDSIVFDHLTPLKPNLLGQFQYYCIDGSYDGLGFKQGKWYYGADLNITNEKKDTDKFYNDPRLKINKIKNMPLIPQKKNSEK